MPTNDNPYAPPGVDDLPQEVPQGEVLASRKDRFLAALIDSIIGLAVIAPVIFGTTILGNFRHPETRDLLTVEMSDLFGLGVILILNGYLLATRAQTIGKRAMGIRIVNHDGSQASFATVVLRRMVPFQMLAGVPVVNYLALVDVLFIFRQDRRCLHDYLAGTRVVKIR